MKSTKYFVSARPKKSYREAYGLVHYYDWRLYTGYFLESSVIVHYSGDAKNLYDAGYGKYANAKRCEYCFHLRNHSLRKTHTTSNFPPAGKSSSYQPSFSNSLNAEYENPLNDVQTSFDEVGTITLHELSLGNVESELHDTATHLTAGDYSSTANSNARNVAASCNKAVAHDSLVADTSCNLPTAVLDSNTGSGSLLLSESKLTVEVSSNDTAVKINNDLVREQLQSIDESLESDVSTSYHSKRGKPEYTDKHLVLSLEEAFYLSHERCSLVVKDLNDIELDNLKLWKIFCQCRSNFSHFYTVYVHFRRKGWVPKCGLKFGCTFLLYKDGPQYNHASFSVLVKLVHRYNDGESSRGSHDSLSWLSLLALNRICENVAKEVLLCYVILPDEISSDNLSIDSIDKFTIQEVLMHRWISSQEREEKLSC